MMKTPIRYTPVFGILVLVFRHDDRHPIQKSASNKADCG